MCTLSMVHDHFDERFKPWMPTYPQPTGWPLPEPAKINPLVLQPPVDLAELRKLIDEFKAAVEAAKTVDRLTGQPDCVDPDKARLQERVDRLEKIIDALLAVRGQE